MIPKTGGLFDVKQKKEIRLYNVIFPVWILLLWPMPPVILLTLFGNLAIDCGVLYLILRFRKTPERGRILKQVWWRVWINGFLADLIGSAWLFAGLFGPMLLEPHLPEGALKGVINDFSYAMTVNPFRSPAAFLVTAIGAALAGFFIYRFDLRTLRRCGDLLSEQDRKRTALLMGIITIPWFFFIPAYW